MFLLYSKRPYSIQTSRENIILYTQISTSCNILFCFISRSSIPSKMCAKLVIAGIWVVSAALAAPTTLDLRVLPNDYIPRHFKPFCHYVGLSDVAMVSYRMVLLALQYLTPLCIISCVYIRIAVALRGSRTPGNAQSSTDSTLMNNNKKVGS
jgi:hypothetical protein